MINYKTSIKRNYKDIARITVVVGNSDVTQYMFCFYTNTITKSSRMSTSKSIKLLNEFRELGSEI